jgi:hypothetical protein
MGRGAAQPDRPPARRRFGPIYAEIGAPDERDLLRASLLEIAGRSPRDSQRLSPLQVVCAEAILHRGGPECMVECSAQGAYGLDRWDVLSINTGQPKLAISAKSLTSSRHNNIANRLKELPGEVLALRHTEPDAVMGFLCVIATEAPGRIGGQTSRHSLQTIAEAVGVRCLRKGEAPLHHFDLGCVIAADLRTGEYYELKAPGLTGFELFVDVLVTLWHQRSGAREASAVRARP